MPRTESSPFISPSLREAVPTNDDAESPITRDYERADDAREKWQRLIDHQLIEWGRDPSQVEDDGLDAPSGQTVQLAIELAEAAKDAGVGAPTRVVPDANGGIVIEFDEKGAFESYRVTNDCSLEYCRFHGSRLIEHEVVNR